MIRVIVELVSAVDRSRSKVLGTMEICNDGTGGRELGNYRGKLDAEYTGKDGRHGHIANFNRQRQSVWSLVGVFLKLWGHTKHTPPATTLTPLERGLLIECVYWRARVAGIVLYEDLPPIMRAVLDAANVPGVATDAEGLDILQELQMRMLFDTPALPPMSAPPTMDDPAFN